MMQRSLHALTLLLTACALVSCHPWMKDVRSMEIVYDEQADIQPGSSIEIGVRLTDKKGKVHSTKGLLNGKVGWNKLNIESDEGDFNGGHLLKLSDQATEFKRHQLKVSCNIIKYPDDTASILIPLNYRGNAILNYNGIDEKAESARGNRILSPIPLSGKTGNDGKPGGNGKNIDLYIRTYKDTAFENRMGYGLFQVVVYNRESGSYDFMGYYAIGKSTLYINAAGGSGGNGGNGGDGMTGRDETTKKSAGTGTDGGTGGYGGTGGDGGNIIIHILNKDLPLMAQLKLNVNGGTGGIGGNGGEGGKGGLRLDGKYESSGSKGINGTNGANGKNGNITFDKESFDWPMRYY